MSTEETRYYLNGIYLHASPGGLAAVATDGHRLARVIVSSAGGLWQGEGCIVPSAAVKGINKLLAAHRDMAEVTLRRSRSLFEIEGGSFRLTSKLIDGTFPDYQRAIGPGGTGKNTVTVCCSDLTAALLRVATAAGNSKMPTAGLAWGNPGQDGLHVCATGGGAAHDVVPLEAVHGKGRVAFQVRHGVDALKAFNKHGVITIDAGNGRVPVYMTGAGEAGPTPFLVVQMPVTWPKLAEASA
jgi:DNA polymerase III subunit beta